MDLDNLFPLLLLICLPLILSLYGISSQKDLVKELDILTKDNYNIQIYDDCYQINSKYYCIIESEN